VFEEHPGYRRAIETAGTVAAPLLAGFSLTLLVLIVPTFAEKSTTVRSGTSRMTSTSDAFSALPEVGAVLLLLAGLLLIASVQAAITARYHGHAPADLEQWYPEYFPEAAQGAVDPPAAVAALSGWDVEGWPAVRTDTKWYAGWLRQYFYEEGWRANRWAGASRHLYHAGVLALLLGLSALVTPPAGAGGFWRWTLFAVAALGAALELAWIVGNSQVWGGVRRRARSGGSTDPADPPAPEDQ
jgi:hypothetical protein